MDLRTIRALSDEAARAAAKAKRQPYVPFDADDIERLPSIPFIGDYVPRGWVLVETLFCDTSGFGSDREPALTRKALVAKMKAGLKSEFGYAVLEAGQFQAHVGVFKKVK